MTVPQMVLIDEGPSSDFVSILRVINRAIEHGTWTESDRDEFLKFQRSNPSPKERMKALQLVAGAINNQRIRVVVRD